MNIDDLFPSKYDKAADLAGAPDTRRIASVRTELMNDGTPKAVLYFMTGKPLVLNVTNKNVLKELYGADTDGWAGKPITLYPTTTEFSGRRVECIRVRSPGAPPGAPVQFAPAAKPQSNTAIPAHVIQPAGEPESFDDLDDLEDSIPF